VNIIFLTTGTFLQGKEMGVSRSVIEEFKDAGHNVHIICSAYNMKRPYTSSVGYGYNVVRVKTTKLTKVKSKLKKAWSYLMFQRKFIRAFKKYYANVKVDLILYSAPPITIEKVVRYIKANSGGFSYLMLKDIFPQNAVDLHMLKKWNPAYWLFRMKEKRLYKISDVIGAMSSANVQYVINHNPYLIKGSVEVLPNTKYPSDNTMDDKSLRQIRKQYGLPNDKTIAVYGGNLGKPQGIGFIIESIKECEDIDSLHFVIVGNGTERHKIECFFKEFNPQNATLLDYIPRDDYEHFVKACDIGLIYLDYRFTIPNFPSRLLSYMNASMPVLAATDINTDLKDIILEGNFGCWCQSNDTKMFRDRILTLLNASLRNRLGENARKYFLLNFTPKKAYNTIIKHF